MKKSRLQPYKIILSLVLAMTLLTGSVDLSLLKAAAQNSSEPVASQQEEPEAVQPETEDAAADTEKEDIKQEETTQKTESKPEHPPEKTEEAETKSEEPEQADDSKIVPAAFTGPGSTEGNPVLNITHLTAAVSNAANGDTIWIEKDAVIMFSSEIVINQKSLDFRVANNGSCTFLRSSTQGHDATKHFRVQTPENGHIIVNFNEQITLDGNNVGGGIRVVCHDFESNWYSLTGAACIGNVTFTRCSTSDNDYGDGSNFGQGGALNFTNKVRPGQYNRVINCEFKDNRYTPVSNFGSSASISVFGTSNARIISCRFTGNEIWTPNVNSGGAAIFFTALDTGNTNLNRHNYVGLLNGNGISDTNQLNTAIGQRTLSYLDSKTDKRNIFLSNKTFDQNRTNLKVYGGAIMGIRQTAVIQDCYFEDNQSETGGAVCFYQQTNLEIPTEYLQIERCTFYHNFASYRGGGVAFVSTIGITRDCLFIENEIRTGNTGTTAGYGGALVLQVNGYDEAVHPTQKGSIVENCVFAGNKAVQNPATHSSHGGAVFMGNGGSVATFPDYKNYIDFRNNQFYGNEAERGGALYSNGQAPTRYLNLYDCYFGPGSATYRNKDNQQVVTTQYGGNRAVMNSQASQANQGRGGAIHLNSVPVTCRLYGNTIIEENEAEKEGGGIYVSTNAALEIPAGSTSGDINSNKAPDGGGIFNASTMRVMNGGTLTLEENSATQGGGALNAGTMTIAGTLTIQENPATRGGGIYNTGTLTTSGTLTLRNNPATGGGGGIYNNGTGTITAGGTVQIEGNTATNHGGGIHSNGGTINVPGNSVLVLDGNKAGLNGGGTYLSNSAVLTAASSGEINLTGNTANNGGGVYMASGTTFTGQTGSTVTATGNTAGNDGGGFYVHRTSDSDAFDARNTLRLANSTFRDNKAARCFDYPLGDTQAMLTDYLSRVYIHAYYDQRFPTVVSCSESPLRPGNQFHHLYNNLDINIHVPDVSFDIRKAFTDGIQDQYMDTGHAIIFRLYTPAGTNGVCLMEVTRKADGTYEDPVLYPDFTPAQRAEIPKNQGFPYGEYWVTEDSGGDYEVVNVRVSPDTNVTHDYNGNPMRFLIQHVTGAPDHSQRTITVTNRYGYNSASDQLTVKKEIEGGRNFPASGDFTVNLRPVYFDSNGQNPQYISGSGSPDAVGALTFNDANRSISFPSSANTDRLAYGVWYEVTETPQMPAGFEPVDITAQGSKVLNGITYIKLTPGGTHPDVTVTNRNLMSETEQITLHVRQIAVVPTDKRDSLYVPQTGYLQLQNKQMAADDPVVEYNAVIDQAGSDYAPPAGYTDLTLLWDKTNNIYTLDPLIPTYYKLQRITGSPTLAGAQTELTNQSVTVSDSEKEFWITIYLEPSRTELELPYARDEVHNDLGTITRIQVS